LTGRYPALDPIARARAFQTEVARLEQLLSWWNEPARTSIPAAHLVLEVSKRKAALLGLDAPQRLDPIRIVTEKHEEPNSTVRLLNELNRIAAERQPMITDETADPDPPPPALTEPDPPAAA